MKRKSRPSVSKRKNTEISNEWHHNNNMQGALHSRLSRKSHHSIILTTARCVQSSPEEETKGKQRTGSNTSLNNKDKQRPALMKQDLSSDWLVERACL
mmetsp:Transcript_20893/g.49618  ORF Transcript_20893/g.49618 Transcript_20893/m.49618 type:complete len:98 (+) Transcript_20893:1597-1890(+)